MVGTLSFLLNVKKVLEQNVVCNIYETDNRVANVVAVHDDLLTQRRSSVRPKPDFGIGNRNQDQVSVSVLVP